MNLRKETILFLVVLALAAWLALASEKSTKVPSASPAARALAAGATPIVVLADPKARTPSREIFREPTEAVPLPPTELPFPALEPLPIVAPPLPLGPQASAFHLLRMPGLAPTPHEFAAPAAENGGDAEAGNPTAPPAQDGGLSEEELNRRFDRIWLEGATPQYGHVLNPGKYALPASGPALEPIQFQYVNRKTGQPTGAAQALDGKRLTKLILADSLENKIARHRLQAGDGQGSVEGRLAFLEELIGHARRESWVWAEVEADAKALVEITKSEVGFAALLGAYRAQGDLGKELAVFDSLPETLADSAFRWREQAELEARLGLDLDAEEHLTRALGKAPTDPAAHHAMAAFLLARGRAAEALPHAEQAARSQSQAFSERQRQSFGEVLVAVQLALGRLADADLAITRIPGDAGRRNELRGAMEYARGTLEAAAGLFARAAEADESGAVRYALGATQLRLGQWNEAKQNLERARDLAPASRARALGALGLLYERTGHPDLALTNLNAAERSDPSDPWVLYLLGRQQRLLGQYDEALVTLRRALALRDDFAEACAEAALCFLGKAEPGVADAPDALARAVRYVDKLVELDASRSAFAPYVELQGYVLARVGETNRARRAFEGIAEKGSDFAKIGLAILDYRQKRSADARTALASLANHPSGAPATTSFARDLVDAIDDHANKEQVRDSFARPELGLWQNEGRLRPTIADERLSFHGASSEESFVRRKVRAGDFLRVEVSMRLLSELATTGFAGLRITNPQRAQDFTFEVGLRRLGGKLVPTVRAVDGQARDGNEAKDLFILEALEIDQRGVQDLAIELVPDADRGSKRAGLRLWWNGRVVHEVATLKGLSQGASFELATDLGVEGKPVQVVFDDYRLVRRKAVK